MIGDNMALRQPESMDEIVYFTRRSLEEGKNGKIQAWTFKEKCVKCNKCIMGKPVDKKTGKVQIRAKEYICPECNYTVPKEEYEDSLTCSISYTCPYCGNTDETTIPFKRKNFQGVKSLVFECGKCKQKIPITKKMKAIKGKEEETEEDI